MDIEQLRGAAMSRRSALKRGAATAFLLSQAALFEQLVIAPARPAQAAVAFSDIQFNNGAFIKPAQILNDGAGNVTVQFGPVFSLFLPAQLNRTPTKTDQVALNNALHDAIDDIGRAGHRVLQHPARRVLGQPGHVRGHQAGRQPVEIRQAVGH